MEEPTAAITRRFSLLLLLLLLLLFLLLLLLLRLRRAGRKLCRRHSRRQKSGLPAAQALIVCELKSLLLGMR